MKYLNVWNEEIFPEVLVALKKDIQRDMDHLYVLLDNYTHKDILQYKSSIKSLKAIRELSLDSTSYQMNQPAKHYLHQQK